MFVLFLGSWKNSLPLLYDQREDSGALLFSFQCQLKSSADLTFWYVIAEYQFQTPGIVYESLMQLGQWQIWVGNMSNSKIFSKLDLKSCIRFVKNVYFVFMLVLCNLKWHAPSVTKRKTECAWKCWCGVTTKKDKY